MATDWGAPPRARLVTVLFTDLVSHSQLWESDPVAMGIAMERHDRELRLIVESHAGTFVKQTGDGVMAVFDDPRDAVAVAAAVQVALGEPEWPVKLRARVGVHTGVAETRGGDWFGATVVCAARLCAAAHGGQVVVSSIVSGVVESAPWIDLGWYELRGIRAPVRIYQLDNDQAARRFGPLRATALNRSTGLPVDRTRLVGRDADVAAVRALLLDYRVVTITGVGGVGKTRLAVEAARRLVVEMGWQPYFIDLTPADEDRTVVAVVGAALHIDPVDDATLALRIHDRLGDGDALIVLDNCEHVVDAAADFVDGLLDRTEFCRVIATSREALRSAGERTWPIGGLAGDESVELFSGLASNIDPTDPIVTRICARLDHLPLAIELAAARAAHLELAELERLLNDRFSLLTGRGRRGSRQRTLESTLDWSYDLLNSTEQAALRRLAAFAGPFTVAAAAELLSIGEVAALDLITALADRSLLVRRDERWAMLETVADYAAHRLVDAGEGDEWRTRHRDLMLRRLESLPMDRLVFPSDTSAALARDWADLRAAVRWSIDREEWDQAIRLTTLITGPMAAARSAEGISWVDEISAQFAHGSDTWLSIERVRPTMHVIAWWESDPTFTNEQLAERSVLYSALCERSLAGSEPRDVFDLLITAHMLSAVGFLRGDHEALERAADCAAVARDRALNMTEPSLFRTFTLILAAERTLIVGDPDDGLRLVEAAVLPPAGCEDATGYVIVAFFHVLLGLDDATAWVGRTSGLPMTRFAQMLCETVDALDAARRHDAAAAGVHLARLSALTQHGSQTWSWLAIFVGAAVAVELDEAGLSGRWLGAAQVPLMASLIPEIHVLRERLGRDSRVQQRLDQTPVPRETLLAEVAIYADQLGASETVGP